MLVRAPELELASEQALEQALEKVLEKVLEQVLEQVLALAPERESVQPKCWQSSAPYPRCCSSPHPHLPNSIHRHSHQARYQAWLVRSSQ